MADEEKDYGDDSGPQAAENTVAPAAPDGAGGGGDSPPPRRRFSNMVEVQFEDGARPKVNAAPGGAACEFVSEAEAFSADEMNTFLVEQRCSKAEPVFDDLPDFDESPELVAEEKEAALTQGVEVPDLRGFYILHFPEDADVHAIAARLRNYPGVRHADALPLITYPSAKPDDDLLFPKRDRDFQWYIGRCRIDKAWDLGYSGKSVVIADIDSGFQVRHPELVGRFNPDCNYNALTDDGNLSTSGDNLRHGTAVAGLAAAAADHQGMAGIAHGADLGLIEVSGGPSRFPCLWVKAIRRVVKFMREQSKRVVIVVEAQTDNGGNVTQIRSIKAALLQAIAHGAVVCVPAGNGDREVSEADCFNPTSPEPCHGLPFKPVGIIVGATMIDDTPYRDNVDPSQATNFGEAVVVSAPGDPTRDLTCSPDLASPFFSTFGATSGAAAKVAGAVALMLEANSELRHNDVIEIFGQTGEPITSKPLGRLLDCEAAVVAAENYPVMAWRARPVAPAPAQVVPADATH